MRISKNKTKKATNPHLKVIIVPVTRAARSKVNNLASSASSFFRHKCDLKDANYAGPSSLQPRFWGGRMAQFSTLLHLCQVDPTILVVSVDESL